MEANPPGDKHQAEAAQPPPEVPVGAGTIGAGQRRRATTKAKTDGNEHTSGFGIAH